MVTTIEKETMSFGSNLRDKEAKIDGMMTIELIHGFITTDEKLEKLTKALREIKGKTEYTNAKLKLPFITPSGILKVRKKSGLVSRTIFFCVDIDNIEDPELIKKKLSKIPSVVLIYTSPSGKGLKVLLVIDPKQAEHLEYFNAFLNYFRTEHGIEIDQACKDITRSSLLCHDPAAHFNPNAKVLGKSFVEQWSANSTEEEPTHTPQKLEEIKFEELPAELDESEISLTGVKALAQAVQRVMNAPDGKKHMVLRNQACRLGYLAKYGIVELSDSFDSLYSAISKRKVNSLKDAKNTILSSLKYGVENAPAFEDLKLYGAPSMYIIGEDDDGKPFLHISYTKLYRFLNYHGFWVYRKSGIRIFVHVEDNIITKVDKHDVIGFVMQHIRTLPWELADGINRDNLEELFRKKMNVLFSENQLSTLELYHPTFNVDDPETAYLYFTNGFLRVTKESVKLLPYSQMQGVIWDTQILEREFTDLGMEMPQLEERSEFAQFLLGVSNNRDGESENRYQSLVSIIGYLLHRYKDPSYSRAIILCDENISQNPSGGSGKGIVLKSLGKFRNTALIDGKNFNFKSQFAFQQVGLDTELIVFEDVTQAFDFERLFSVITEGISVEKKGQDRFFIPFEENPKIVITTNYMIVGNGNSHNRRKVEYEFSKFYNESHTPNSEFGHNLYDDWGKEQWGLFDNFMVGSIQFFIRNGVIDPPQINIAKRKLLQETGEEFVAFAEDYLDRLIGIERSKNLIREDFISKFREFEDFHWFTARFFNKWLRTYADIFGLECRERVSNNNQLILFTKK